MDSWKAPPRNSGAEKTFAYRDSFRQGTTWYACIDGELFNATPLPHCQLKKTYNPYSAKLRTLLRKLYAYREKGVVLTLLTQFLYHR